MKVGAGWRWGYICDQLWTGGWLSSYPTCPLSLPLGFVFQASSSPALLGFWGSPDPLCEGQETKVIIENRIGFSDRTVTVTDLGSNFSSITFMFFLEINRIHSWVMLEIKTSKE